MTRECEICGGRLRTGIKYCHKCRSLGRYGNIQRKVNNAEVAPIWAVVLVMVIILISGGVLSTLLFKNGHYGNDVKITNLPSESKSLGDFCKNLTSKYPNINEAVYFDNKTKALTNYYKQEFANNTQSYIISICRIDQIRNNESAVVYYRSVWWSSPIVCTERGLLKCPNAEDVNEKI